MSATSSAAYDGVRAPLRVGNCSGFYGDRLSAMREMLEGGELDVLTGDYLAELTMLILARDRAADPAAGYARTFLRQLEDGLGLALEQGVSIVTNAGGVNPAGLATAIRDLATRLGLAARVGYVAGDDLTDRADALGLGTPLAAHAYLGAFGIAECLTAGADVVVTGRVTDASVIVGPAIAHFGWGRSDLDELAGAVAAGHIIECGTQATGGNFSFFTELPDLIRPGFPIAEIAADGACVITKHPGTGGAVTVETVLSQLLYEVTDARYAGPDVTLRLDSLRLAADGPDRVRVSGARGEAPPPDVKVSCTSVGGYRNEMTFVLTGLEIEAKADLTRRQFADALGQAPAEVSWALARTDRADADTEETASARLTVVARDPDPKRVARAFSGPAVEIALGSYPGFHATTPPGSGQAYGVYVPGYVPQTEPDHHAVLPDGTRVAIAAPTLTRPLEPLTSGEGELEASWAAGPGDGVGVAAAGTGITARSGVVGAAGPEDDAAVPDNGAVLDDGASAEGWRTAARRRAPLGLVAGARSGDKGGNANVGLWARTDAGWEWLVETLTVERLRGLLPEVADLPVTRTILPAFRALNFVIEGILGEGVAYNARFDPQAKGLAEWLRSRHLDIPESLLPEAPR